MSRLAKLIASVMVLAAGGGAAVGAAVPGAASAQRGSNRILCPVVADAADPCCGPPVAATASVEAACCGPVVTTCCGTPTPVDCPVELTASSSADPSNAGHKVTISGHWTSGTAGQAVDLWQKLPGAKKFTQVASTKTDSSGNYSFVRRGVMTNRQWYTTAGSDQSATIDQQVKAVVTFLSSGIPRSSRWHLHGRVTPNHAGERIRVERNAGTRWTVIARPRLSADSTYAFTGSLCKGAMRVVFPADGRNVGSASRERVRICGGY